MEDCNNYKAKGSVKVHTNHLKFWPARVAKTLTVPETTLYDNLVITAKKYPNKMAVQYYGAPYTYQQLLDEVEQLAGYLEKTLYVKQDEKVLLFMQNAPQFLISFFAILRVRAVVVPINPMSTTEDLAFYVNDCAINHALIGQELYDKIAPLKKDALIESVIVAAYSTYADKTKENGDLPEEATAAEVDIPDTVQWNQALAAEQQASLYNGHADDAAVIPYTSGTTGLPKGCVHTNRTVQANTVGAYHWNNITPDAVTLVTLPLFHVTGLLHSMLTPVLAGGMMVLLTRWDRDYAGKAIEKYRCSHWVNISTMLIDFLANPKLEEYNVSSLQFVGVGGAPLPEAVVQQLAEWTGLQS